MHRILCALAVACMLSSCAPQPHLVINKGSLVDSGEKTLAAMEAAVTAYKVNHKLLPGVDSVLVFLDGKAHATLTDLSAADLSAIPIKARQVADSIQAIVNVIPPGILPVGVQAGLTAFNALVDVVVQTAPVQTTAVAPAAPAPSTGTVPSAPVAPPPVPAVISTAPAPTVTSAEAFHAPVHPGAPPQ